MPNLPISQLPDISGSTLGYLGPDGEFAVAQGGVTYKVKSQNLTVYPQVFGLFSQTSNGPTVAATTTESSIIGTGVGTLSVPASGFSVGDSFSVRIVGHISSKNNDTIRIRVKSGSVVLGDSGLITMPQTTSKHFTIDSNFTIRQIGVAGVASIVTGLVFTYSKDASNAFEGSDFSTINNSTFDTTTSNTLNITVQWGSTDAQNSIYTEYFVLNKVY